MVYEHHNYSAEDIVIKLHDTARTVEQEVGQGKLSKELRDTADRLNELLKGRKNG